MNIKGDLLNLFCLLGLMGAATGVGTAQTSVIINNLTGDYTGATELTGNESKAMGFTMGAYAYDLNEVRAPLYLMNLDSMPALTLHSNNAQNNPGAVLLEFEPVLMSLGGSFEVIFRPKAEPFNTFRLQSSTTYWLVLRPMVKGYFTWRIPTGNTLPSGVATHFGSRSGNFPPTSASATINAYQMKGAIRPGTGLFFQDPSSGRIGVASDVGLHFTNWRTFPQVVGSGYEVLIFGHFGGTQHADALLRHKTTGELAFWQTNGYNFGTFVPVPQVPPSVWEFKGAARTNTTLDSLFFQNPQSGVVVVGIHDGTQITQWRIFPKVPNPAWEIVAVNSFTSNNVADVMFRNKTTGQFAVWQTNGNDFTTWNQFPQIPSAQWEIVGKMNHANFSMRRVVFRNKSTGDLATWETNNTATAFDTWRPFVAKQPAGYVFKGFGVIE